MVNLKKKSNIKEHCIFACSGDAYHEFKWEYREF